MSASVRIHKALADAGVASRRAAEQLVGAGRVTINGVTAMVGQRVDPARDALSVDGRPVGRPGARLYLLLAKPAGVTSTVSDRHAARTVIDLVPPALRSRAARLYPVGRLDRDSEGLILLTNDGEWAQRMLHPRHAVEREYAIGLGRPLTDFQRHELATGVELDEGLARLHGLRAATSVETRRLAELAGPGPAVDAWYRAVLQQGWKRQLRRMFEAVGAPVERLVRVRFGTLRLHDLRLGEVREVTGAERRQLDQLVQGEGSDVLLERRLVVSIDGPGGSGKSSVGANAATALGYRFCDTGVLYRGLALLALRRAVDPADAPALAELATQLQLVTDGHERYVRLIADGAELTAELHRADVDATVARVSAHAAVRAGLLPVQRRLAEAGGIIMAGRDIGTVVLPDADLKIYLEVSVAERARRRAQQRGVTDPAERAQIEADLRRRDELDSTRAAAPLRVPDDAVVINSDGNTLEQTVAMVVELIERTARGG